MRQTLTLPSARSSTASITENSADPGKAGQPVGTIYIINSLSGTNFARIRLTAATGIGTAGYQLTFEYIFNNADASSTF